MLKIKISRLATLLALAGMLNLAGCGQTGPLYLPQKLAQAAKAPVSLSATPTEATLRAS